MSKLKQATSDRLAQVLSILPAWLERAFDALEAGERSRLEEIRIQQGQPLMACARGTDLFVTPGGLSTSPDDGFPVERHHVESALEAITHSSVYALEECMREGFLTLPGGHRVGLSGRPRVAGGEVRGFAQITGLSIRINRPVPGAARAVLPSLMRPGGTIHSTLILSPPGCGKTTLLRDLVRLLSYGDGAAGLRPHRVGVADERSEIAGSHFGVPQNDLGPRTVVIDACPKRLAMPMLVRAQRPDVVATDEIGHPDDPAAVAEAKTSGVALICTAHAHSAEEARRRPSLRPLLEGRYFGRVVVLSRRSGPGTVERIAREGDEG